MIHISIFVLALFLWFLLRALDNRGSPGDRVPCRTCWMEIYWTGDHFVHVNGEIKRPYSPPIYLDPTDPDKGELLHTAVP